MKIEINIEDKRVRRLYYLAWIIILPAAFMALSIAAEKQEELTIVTVFTSVIGWLAIIAGTLYITIYKDTKEKEVHHDDER